MAGTEVARVLDRCSSVAPVSAEASRGRGDVTANRGLVASGPRFEDSPAVPGETLVVSNTTKSATVTLATQVTVNVGKLMADSG